MRETRIYDSGDGWLRKEELWHGGSETVLLSSTIKRDGILRRWKPYKKEETINESWLSAELKRAGENGDL